MQHPSLSLSLSLTYTHAHARPPPPPGITVNQLQSCAGNAEALPAGALLPAILCVAGSVTVPSAASVYNEFALKKHMDTSVHLQNFFLYFYGACFNALGVLGVCAFKRQGLAELFGGQTRVTAVLIVNNAAQVTARAACLCLRLCAAARFRAPAFPAWGAPLERRREPRPSMARLAGARPRAAA